MMISSKIKALLILLAFLAAVSFAADVKPYYVEALYYLKTARNGILCNLCPNQCALAPGQTGKCLIRKNVQGTLYATAYGKLSSICKYDTASLAMPGPLVAMWAPRIEIGGYGCSLKCAFCYAGEIVQTNPEDVPELRMYYTPEDIIAFAKKRNVNVITFSNNSEAFINYEYTNAVVDLAKKNGIKVFIVTGGNVSLVPFIALAKKLDGVFFSLKGFSDETYQKYTSGSFPIVLQNLKLLRENKIPVDILYLLIPTVSDSDKDIRAMSHWVKVTLGAYTPVHFMAFSPKFKLKNLPRTPLETIKKSMTIAHQEGLQYVTPYANGAYNIREVIRAGLMALQCPYCHKVVAEYVLDNDNVPMLKTHFGKNYACGFCGNTFLNLSP